MLYRMKMAVAVLGVHKEAVIDLVEADVLPERRDESGYRWFEWRELVQLRHQLESGEVKVGRNGQVKFGSEKDLGATAVGRKKKV